MFDKLLKLWVDGVIPIVEIPPLPGGKVKLMLLIQLNHNILGLIPNNDTLVDRLWKEIEKHSPGEVVDLL